mgnify:CR=1 FL=1
MSKELAFSGIKVLAVARIVAASGVTDGMVLVSAMHITSGVFVNDWEDNLRQVLRLDIKRVIAEQFQREL